MNKVYSHAMKKIYAYVQMYIYLIVKKFYSHAKKKYMLMYKCVCVSEECLFTRKKKIYMLIHK
jgi:hypothetical protein